MGTDQHDQEPAPPDREITREQADESVDLETTIARHVRRYRVATGLLVPEMAACTMRPGDARQRDGAGAHGPQDLVELPVHFPSVTAFGDSGRD
ncbi:MULTISPECIES: hypothetical protein [unclassified Streptomyces]|uniref:hypothetical protein n=1 Tax=unclassified Streptomyces TaxID=2593676 RepID=UPI002E27EF05|nr:hypothetical protein [Streptomyces sp. NBC_00228]